MAETRQRKAQRTLHEWKASLGLQAAPGVPAHAANNDQDHATARPLDLLSPPPGGSTHPARTRSKTKNSATALGASLASVSRPSAASSSVVPRVQLQPPSPGDEDSWPPPDNSFPSGFGRQGSVPVHPLPQPRRPLNFQHFTIGKTSGTFRPSIVMGPPSGFEPTPGTRPYDQLTVGTNSPERTLAPAFVQNTRLIHPNGSFASNANTESRTPATLTQGALRGTFELVRVPGRF